jgi:hypothetical protein
MYVTPPAAPADEPGIAWSLVATAAILVALVATYLLASQAFGPDICLTRLSYGAPDLDLAWPGKITLNR